MKRLLLLLLLPRLAFADPELPDQAPLYHCEKPPAKVEVSFKPETDLKELVSWAMGFTCKNFMYDPSAVARAKKVNLVTPNLMSPEEAYQVFQMALSTMGFAIVAQNGVLRIVESATARAEPLPIYSKIVPSGESIIRFVLRPSFTQTQTLVAALNAMKSQAGDIQTVGSVVLITDYSSHVRDMMDVVKLIDVPGGTDGIYTIPIVHADATVLGKTIDGLMATSVAPAASKDPAPPQPATKVLVDARTNTLVVAASQAGYERVKALAERLDVQIEAESGGQMHIYRLKAAIAEEVAKVLNDAISGKTSAAVATGGEQAGRGGRAGATCDGDVGTVVDRLARASKGKRT